MGLTFDLANPFAVVSEVTPGGLSHRAGVKVGDHLVRNFPLPLVSPPTPRQHPLPSDIYFRDLSVGTKLDLLPSGGTIFGSLRVRRSYHGSLVSTVHACADERHPGCYIRVLHSFRNGRFA